MLKRFSLALLQWVLLAAVSVGMFRLCVELYTRHNTFPAAYHPDEGSKADQILSDDRNFNHPLLMLEAALWVMDYNPPQDREAVVQAGRWTSAYLAAAGAVMIAWVGYFAAGRAGFLMAGLGAGFCPALLSHAHFFKEDASLLFGIAATLCVGAAMAKRRHWSIMLLLSLLLGAACGTAASGKYVGAVIAIPALVLVIAVCWKRWWILPLCPILFTAGLYGSWVTINHRAVANWEVFLERFEREKLHGLTGHEPVRLGTPNLYFIDLAWIEAMPHVKVLVIAAPFALLLMRQRRKTQDGITPVHPPHSPPRLFGWWLILTLIVFAFALSYGMIPFFRYALPITLILYTLAAISAVWVAECLDRPYLPQWLVVCVLACLIGSTQWERCQNYLHQFANDSRDELRAWVESGEPRGVMVVDSYTELSGRWGAVRKSRFAAQQGSIDDLRREGVRYVITASTNCDRFLSPHTIATEGDEQQFLAYSVFYRTLFEKYPIVKQWKAEHPMWNNANPDIYVFEINGAASAPQRQRARRWWRRG